MTFQNQPISKNRTDHKISSTRGFSNRDLLPRLCISTDKNKNNKDLSADIIFNDQNLIAQSTLLTQKTFTLKMHYVYLDVLQQRNLLVLTVENLKLNESIRLENLLPGSYLIEVIHLIFYIHY